MLFSPNLLLEIFIRLDDLKILLQRAKNSDLPTIYAIYFKAFKQSGLQGTILYDIPQRQIERLSLPKVMITHLFHIMIERLIVVSQKGSVSALFQNNSDMIPFKITLDGEIVGFCFLKWVNLRVMEVGLIGVLKCKRGLGIGFEAIDLVKKYAKHLGVSRLVVRASGIKHSTGFFNKCGFKQAFCEEVFFEDII